MLVTRGMCLRFIGDLDGARSDLRASCTALRMTKQKWMGWPTIHEAQTNLLAVMAMKKIEEGASRPHYTSEEREAIEKELGLGKFSKDHYLCSWCGAKSSDSVKLRQCNGCHSIWLCGKDCQRKSWRSQHRTECDKMKRNIVHALVGGEASCKANIERNGCLELRNNEQEPCIIVFDNATGEYFDSLQDDNAYIFPLERLMNVGHEAAATLLPGVSKGSEIVLHLLGMHS